MTCKKFKNKFSKSFMKFLREQLTALQKFHNQPYFLIDAFNTSVSPYLILRFLYLQMLGLEKRFEKQQYLSTPDRVELAEVLGLSQLQVKTWYQNRRMKWKKQVILCSFSQ